MSTQPSTGHVTVDVLLTPDDLATMLRTDVRTGLAKSPKSLPPKWFYDDRGCALFDAITRLPEYYPTETERGILLRNAEAIAEQSQADTVVELGSGTSDKTRTLLDAFAQSGRLRRFVPFDVNEATVRAAAERLAQDYPGLSVHAVIGDFEHHLRALPTEGRRLVAFLGSTLGNFAPEERKDFLSQLAGILRPGDSLLLGTDLVKDVGRLEAAYNDAAGITAEFNLNVLRMLNRELGADFNLDAFVHHAFFDPVNEWIEMQLVSATEQRVQVSAVDLIVDFSNGEQMRTEISAKFRRERVEAELAEVGLHLTEWMTDPAEDFALSLAFVD
ncbi:MAG: L-histidine N(alpha)-methyltransferase [Acidimicrobiales bacterium]|nr:L-histidine N(alpha)-methyltransferase [Acidimicrobiales bacterium]